MFLAIDQTKMNEHHINSTVDTAYLNKLMNTK